MDKNQLWQTLRSFLPWDPQRDGEAAGRALRAATQHPDFHHWLQVFLQGGGAIGPLGGAIEEGGGMPSPLKFLKPEDAVQSATSDVHLARVLSNSTEAPLQYHEAFLRRPFVKGEDLALNRDKLKVLKMKLEKGNLSSVASPTQLRRIDALLEHYQARLDQIAYRQKRMQGHRALSAPLSEEGALEQHPDYYTHPTEVAYDMLTQQADGTHVLEPRFKELFEKLLAKGEAQEFVSDMVDHLNARNEAKRLIKEPGAHPKYMHEIADKLEFHGDLEGAARLRTRAASHEAINNLEQHIRGMSELRGRGPGGPAEQNNVLSNISRFYVEGMNTKGLVQDPIMKLHIDTLLKNILDLHNAKQSAPPPPPDFYSQIWQDLWGYLPPNERPPGPPPR